MGCRHAIALGFSHSEMNNLRLVILLHAPEASLIARPLLLDLSQATADPFTPQTAVTKQVSERSGLALQFLCACFCSF